LFVSGEEIIVARSCCSTDVPGLTGVPDAHVREPWTALLGFIGPEQGGQGHVHCPRLTWRVDVEAVLKEPPKHSVKASP
jgi:hypothetical protein